MTDLIFAFTCMSKTGSRKIPVFYDSLVKDGQVSVLHGTLHVATVLATEIRPPWQRGAPPRGSDFSCQHCTLYMFIVAGYMYMV